MSPFVFAELLIDEAADVEFVEVAVESFSEWVIAVIQFVDSLSVQRGEGFSLPKNRRKIFDSEKMFIDYFRTDFPTSAQALVYPQH